MSDSILRALGWTLAHSLWQGAVAAIILLALLPRLQTARQRYGVAYGTLLLIFVAAIVTFVWTYEPLEQASVTLNLAPESASPEFFWGAYPYLQTDISSSFSQWLEANHALIVVLWLIGFVFFLLRLGGGLWHVYRLQTRGLSLLDQDWQDRLLALSNRIAVPRSVKLFESAWVHAPLTIGWLKPAILLPFGFVNQLSPAEVEAVLAHELAHIARRDWVFNLVQAFVETIFYYHPAVWWVSQVIRRERENACDDTALAATGNPIAFARALVRVQEMAAPVPSLALAMHGKQRRPLLERVRRILNQAPQQQHQVMEKITATVILLVLLALIGLRANSVQSIEAAFAQIADFPSAIFDAPETAQMVESDSLPRPKGSRKITREDENGRVEAEYKNGKITRLNIDGKDIPESEFAAHEDLIDELEEEVAPPPPPAPFFWGTPDMPTPPAAPGTPDAPRAFWFPNPGMPALAPMPPMDYMGQMSALGGISITTDKDEDGNTLIMVDKGGNTTEVVIKKGEVWIDGKKVEKGESIDIPGLHFGQNGEQYFFGHPEGFGQSSGEGNYSYGYGNADAYAASPEQRAKLQREMDLMREELARNMEESHRNFEQDQKEAEKAWKESQKAWEKEQKAREKEQKNWEKEQQKWARDQKKWEKEQQKWQEEQRVWEAKNKAFQERLKTELLKDGLITDPENFSMQLNSKEMKVNKKVQSEEMRRKYLELMESATGNKLKDGGSYFYNFNEEN